MSIGFTIMAAIEADVETRASRTSSLPLPQPLPAFSRAMSAKLSESEFEMLADETLEALVESLSSLEDDGLEADLESGVLTIRYEDGAKHVINSHRAAGQIWMAAGTTAWHFSWNGSRWLSTRSGDELWATVNEKVGSKLNREIDLQRQRE